MALVNKAYVRVEVYSREDKGNQYSNIVHAQAWAEPVHAQEPWIDAENLRVRLQAVLDGLKTIKATDSDEILNTLRSTGMHATIVDLRFDAGTSYGTTLEEA